MALFSKPLLKWTEPRAYGKVRARESRHRWRFGIPLLGAIWATFIILNALLKAQFDPPVRTFSTVELIIFWFVAFGCLTALIWGLSFVPLCRLVLLRKDSLRAGRLTIRFNEVKSVVWENQGEFWVLTFEMQSGTRKEFGVPLNIQPDIAGVLKGIKTFS